MPSLSMLTSMILKSPFIDDFFFFAPLNLMERQVSLGLWADMCSLFFSVVLDRLFLALIGVN